MKIRQSLMSKLILIVGTVLLVSMATWSYFNVHYQMRRVMQNIVHGTDRLTNTIRLGTHYSMMLNSRDDISQIIQNIGRQPEIENIRIYNKQGQIKFSINAEEIDSTTNIKNEACYICHRTEPPQTELNLDQRTRIFDSGRGYRLLGIITPIFNEPGCATECHFHPADKKVLGALDVVVSLADVDREIGNAKKSSYGLLIFVFVVTSMLICVFVLRFVNRPIKRLIEGTRSISKGDYNVQVNVEQDDEMGQLAGAINRMCSEISKHEEQLNKQRDEYQELFEGVPCLITVQDQNYRLLRFNREFFEKFEPEPGNYCFHAYKGRKEKCLNCPVEKTFADGLSHVAEETGVNKDGTPAHWLVRTSPIRDADGKIVAAMEISLDITERKLLEVQLEKSEEKYHAFFNNIPNPVFVLDMDTFRILDCNDSVQAVYGHHREEVIGESFFSLFVASEEAALAKQLRSASEINQARHRHRSGRNLFVNIRISPSEYSDRKVLLVTTSDITKRLEAEQQLIQASKMATLGEMATGVAHELNQPLSVIKTASSFLLKKVNGDLSVDPKVLHTMLDKVDRNIDRAANIINHMRQFARKSDLELEKVQINDVLLSAFEIFSQQLKVRGIDVVWELDRTLPPVEADMGRLEQVFINLLLNARDAIEEHWDQTVSGEDGKVITIRSYRKDGWVCCEVRDTGGGIPEAVAEKIFEPFFTTKEVGKGTGLGLSISYGIVKECRGTIEAVSSEGGGAAFIVSFPVQEENHAA
ncbi:MAG: PAS domain S-box protein [Desulfobacteraceae bacterium]|nr:PAS domain S-box protein [Desulfobacteraceae bacterium]